VLEDFTEGLEELTGQCEILSKLEWVEGLSDQPASWSFSSLSSETNSVRFSFGGLVRG
jgi:hypothetical protein